MITVNVHFANGRITTFDQVVGVREKEDQYILFVRNDEEIKIPKQNVIYLEKKYGSYKS